MQTKQITAAYDLFVEIHADYAGKTVAQVQAEINSEKFEEQIHRLHEQYIAGEFSIGRFTELMGVPHWELWEILELLGLPVHN
jgi:hypothetical protein